MLHQAVLLIAAIAYLEVIRQDFTYRRIPNPLSIVIAILACVHLALIGNLAFFGLSVAVATVIFGITVIFFARGWLGGGDVKLIAVSSLLVGYQYTYRFLVYMALAGGILSLAMLIDRLIRRRKDSRKPTVPYGIAISLSAMLVLIMQYRQGLG